MTTENETTEVPEGTEVISSKGKRLSKVEWAAAEEMVKAGETFSTVAEKFGVTLQAVSAHMTRKNIKAGEKVNQIQKEIAASLLMMKRQFAEKKIERQIKAQEQMYNMVQALLAQYYKDFKQNSESKMTLAGLSNSVKALRDGLSALKIAREELYTILGVDPAADKAEEAPELVVREMSHEEEEALRNAKLRTEEEEDAVEEMVGELTSGLDDDDIEEEI